MITRAGHIFWIVLMALWLVAGAPSHHHSIALHAAGTSGSQVAAVDASDCDAPVLNDHACGSESSRESQQRRPSERDCSICHLISSIIATTTIQPPLPTAQLLAILPVLEPDAMSGLDQFLISRGRGPPVNFLSA